jgi:tripartite-type tricarboxylate transporter receptor subunit TctC
MIRRGSAALIALCGMTSMTSAVLAQSYPNRPVRFIVPYPPGGATDIISRSIGAKVSAVLGQQFIIDNRPGGGQKIGTALVAKAPPDGYTMLLVSVTHSINPSLDPKLPYDSIRDFIPVSLVASSPNVVVVHPSVPVRSVGELVTVAKAHRGKLNLATSGNGSGGHLAAEYFQALAGVRMTAIPYKGGGPAYVDLMGGQVDLMFTSPNPTLSYAKAGKLRAIATTGAKRSGAAPELPTIAESTGFDGYEASLWYGIMLPAGTPREIVQLLNTEIVRAAKSDEMRRTFAAQAVDMIGTSPEGFAQHMKREMDKWAKVIKDGNIRAD